MRIGLVASIMVLGISAGAVFLVPPPAAAQNADLQQLLDRLGRVERDIRTLNLQVARGGSGGGASGATAGAVAGEGGGGPAMARLSIRVTQVEDDLRMLTGRIEEILHKVNQVSNRFDKLVGDVDYRLSALEQGNTASAPPPAGSAAAPSAQAAPAPPAPRRSGVLGTMSQRELSQGTAQLPAATDGTQTAAAGTAAAAAAVALPAGTPRDKYNFAYGLLRQARYDEAEQAFEQFLTAHAEDPLAQNAQYWLGKVYFVREEYVLAAQTFTDNYKTYPKGPKAPDSLLNLGLSLSRLDKASAACAAFDELKRKFPRTSPRIARTVKAQWAENGCR